jgi:hypothetical protein
VSATSPEKLQEMAAAHKRRLENMDRQRALRSELSTAKEVRRGVNLVAILILVSAISAIPGMIALYAFIRIFFFN